MVTKICDFRDDEMEEGVPPVPKGSAAEGDTPSGSRTGSSTTSRISIQKIHSVVAGFSEYKNFLVDEIGFGGVRKIPLIPKISLKFSKWIMERVDLKEHCIVLGGCHKPLKLYHQDFHKVFGIPCGERNIYSTDADTTPEAVEFMRNCIGWNDKSDHSLKTLEAFLGKDIVETSSRLEKDCFKMAFVVFVMGYLFAPCSKFDYTIIDYWGAIKDSDNIDRFNWCKYAFDALMDSVDKLQAEAASSSSTHILFGCHLFLQVYLLDNVNLGNLNLKQNVLPRISLFNAEQMRRMILMCKAKINGESVFLIPMARDGTSVCYTRHNFLSEDFRQDGTTPVAKKPPGINENVPSPLPATTPAFAKISNSNVSPLTGVAAVFTPNQYTVFLHTHYPNTAASPLGWALKEHNAKCVQIVSKMKNDMAAENLRFTEKVIQQYSRVIDPTVLPTTSSNYKSKSVGKEEYIIGRKLDLSESPSLQGIAQSRSGTKSKGDQPSSSSTVKSKKSRMDEAPDAPGFDLGIADLDEVISPGRTKTPPSSISPVREFSGDLVCQMLMMNDEIGESDGHIIFGQTNNFALSGQIPQNARHTKFVTCPYSNNVYPRLHTNLVRKAICGWIENRTTEELCSVWVSHPEPRLISIEGHVMKSQVYNAGKMDHDLCALVARRLGQIDCSRNAIPECWRKILEPDFALLALAGEAVIDIASIQAQFLGQSVRYNLANCQMFFAPAIMPHGWCCFCWDMKDKMLTVIDPLAYTVDGGRKKTLMLASEKLHGALFDCLETFYTGWHCNRNQWRRKCPMLTTTGFTSADTGMCVVHIMKHFTGKALSKQLTHGIIHIERGSLLVDLIHMEGNTAMLQLEALDIVAQAAEDARSDGTASK